jgi:peptidyl-prolyl cis-trans isomerase C
MTGQTGAVSWWRDPIVAFLGLGAAIFLAWWLLQPREDEIRITPEIVAGLVQDHRQLTGRAPSAAERRALVEDWLAEELLFRESLARGLHLNDPQTRERLVERMKLVLGGVPPEPAEADLRDHYASHQARYVQEPLISLEHVYFATQPADPDAILQRLRRGEKVAGEDFWMGRHLADYGQSMLRGMFGEALLDAARRVPIGQWHGPYPSPRGVHFIRVETRVPARPLPYPAAREQVRMDWQAAAAEAPVSREVARLRGKYRIINAP